MRAVKLFLNQMLASALLCTAVYADDAPFLFEVSPLSSELSQKTVLQVYQDQSGYLWILTQEGLNRWDGVDNLIFSSDVNIPGTISGSDMRGIVQDDDGNLWIGTFGGGLNRYTEENQTFLSLRASGDTELSPYTDRIWSLTKGTENQIWIGYRDGGFSLFETEI